MRIGSLDISAVLLLFVACLPSVSGATEIEAVEFRAGSGTLRIVLDMDAEPAFEVFTLADPMRLVVDFDGPVTLEPTDIALPGEIISTMRHGLFRPGRSRIVMDLAAPMIPSQIDVKADPDGAELIIDLSLVTAADFVDRSSLPEEAVWSDTRIRDFQTGGDLVVVIDPGHGGIDPGANAFGLLEKDVVLTVGRALAERISAIEGMTAILTRSEDVFLPLRARLRVAREAQAHVFVSLHADSLLAGQADGVSIYTLSEESSDKAANQFAERENRADVLAGADLVGEEDDVARLLVDLARRGTDIESDKLARTILGSLDGKVDLLRTRPYRQAGFFVLRSPDVPSVLIELGFLTSEVDRARFLRGDYAERVADAVTQGIVEWKQIADPEYTAPRTD